METKLSESEIQREVDAFVNREVIHCASMLVTQLSNNEGAYLWDEYPDIYQGYDEEAEVFEHWIVSGWLANQLEAKNETIVRDFYGFTIWNRCTTGQAISMDGVIRQIWGSLQNA